MKTQALYAIGEGRVALREREVPDPSAGEARVRTRATAISPGTERAFMLGLENARPKYPVPMGYCGAGIVEAVGASVDSLKPGDRVAGMIGHQGCNNVSASRLAALPDSISFEAGAYLPLGIIATQGVRKARLELGESAAVLGLGPVGLLALQAAKIAGATPLAAIDRAPNRLEIARALGADVVLNTAEANWMESLRAACGGVGPDVVVEVTGSPEAVSLAFQSARNQGRVVMLGCPRGLTEANLYRDLEHKGLTVIGSHLFSHPEFESRPGFWTWRDEARTFLRYLAAGRFALQPLISRRVPAARCVEAYRDLANWDPSLISAVIEWE